MIVQIDENIQGLASLISLYDRRLNNAGIAGEGSREGYEDTPKDDPSQFSQQLLKSEFNEWNDILNTNIVSYYVRRHLAFLIL